MTVARARRSRTTSSGAAAGSAEPALVRSALDPDCRPARQADERPAIDTSKIQHQLDNLQELFIVGDIGREEYVGRSRALKASLLSGVPQPTYSEAVLVQAARLLADLGRLWTYASPAERAEIMQNLFAEVRVRDHDIVYARLASEEYLPLIASAEARKPVGMARPEGSEHASPTIVIEGVAELIAALRAA